MAGQNAVEASGRGDAAVVGHTLLQAAEVDLGVELADVAAAQGGRLGGVAPPRRLRRVSAVGSLGTGTGSWALVRKATLKKAGGLANPPPPPGVVEVATGPGNR